MDGKQVLIHSLSTAAGQRLNGQIGTVIKVCEEDDLLYVQLSSASSGTNAGVRVSRSNVCETSSLLSVELKSLSQLFIVELLDQEEFKQAKQLVLTSWQQRLQRQSPSMSPSAAPPTRKCCAIHHIVLF